MKVKVVREFRDKFNFNKVYKVGNFYEFDNERAKDIIARGLGEAEVVEKPKPRKKKDDQQGIHTAETVEL